MKILSVNAGSSSLKFTLFDMPEEKELISGVFERIGIENSFYTIKLNGEKIKKETELKDHKAAFELLVKELIDNKIVDSLDEIAGIGHRIVQGGSYFDKTVLATEDNISIVEKLSSLAPLHNPAAVVGIRAAQSVFPNATQTLVFDTAFHQTMEEEVYLYPVPYEWYTKYAVRRNGAHGTSHKYVSMRTNEILDNEDARLITCHIGNGASISAVKAGKCVETSMGLTPNAGLMMGTRCGDIDAGVIPYLMEKKNLTSNQILDYLNKKSGILGISGISSDLREVIKASKDGDIRSKITIEMLCNRIKKYLCSYAGLMGGVDAICFTAGIGENSDLIREKVCHGLEFMGIELDVERNRVRELGNREISKKDSRTKIYIIPTNEELVIAKDTYNLVKSK